MRCQPVRITIRSFLVALLLGALPATAATIAVNTLADELNADGDCSLREALQAANANAAVDACTAGTPGLDTVVLPAGTIPLSVTINVTDAVTVAAGAPPRFARPWACGDIIDSAGTLLGWNGGEPFHTPYERCVLIMPTLVHATPGATLMRLGREQGPGRG